MIPAFPVFKKIELSDKEAIEDFTKNFLPFSDFNFLSLWVYNTENNMIISELHNNLVVRFNNYTTNELFYSFIGNNKVVETSKMLIDQAKKDNMIVDLLLIPAANITEELIVSTELEAIEDPDNNDYILSLSDISSLATPKYHSKKRLVNFFSKTYTTCSSREIDLRDEETQKKIINLFSVWETGTKKLRSQTEHELKALYKLLEMSYSVGLFTLGFFDKDLLIGFLVTEKLTDEYHIGHFVKADPSYRGIFEYIYSVTATELIKRGGIYFNVEQDLGIDNLRKAKQLWRPKFFLKKYTIKRK